MNFEVSELKEEKRKYSLWVWINIIIIIVFQFLYKKMPKKVMLLRKISLYLVCNKDANVIGVCIHLDEIFEFYKCGEPKRCTKCGKSEFNENIINMLDGRGIVLEKEAICSNCNNKSGYWSHGSWMY